MASPGSKRIAVPAAMSSLRPAASSRGNTSAALTRVRGKCEPTWIARSPVFVMVTWMRARVGKSTIGGASAATTSPGTGPSGVATGGKVSAGGTATPAPYSAPLRSPSGVQIGSTSVTAS